jgi:HEPN domain-containing protein
MTAEIASFHAQQEAEKALKALLISRGVAIPKTHDLEELHRLVGGGFEPAAEELAPLTPYAVQSRYPDWPVQPTPADDADRGAARRERRPAQRGEEHFDIYAICVDACVDGVSVD